MREFATGDNFAPLRGDIQPVVSAADRFEFLRVEAVGDSGAQRYLYRVGAPGRQLYFLMTWRDGRLTALDWADE
jgi:hypothetical protein